MSLEGQGSGALAPIPAETTSVDLLVRARGGDRGALNRLFERLAPGLRRWARGRLPRWARASADTGDVVQEAMVRVFRRIEHFEPRRQRALQAYLRQAVMNRIRDEIRASRRREPSVDVDDVDLSVPETLFDRLVDREQDERYRKALSKLRPEDREAIVARLELAYTYEQVAIASGRPSAEAARVAVRRALLRLAEVMSGG